MRGPAIGGSIGIVDIMLPEPDCWLTGAVAPHPSSIEGSGLFAVRPILAGEAVARFGGRMVSDAELADLLWTASTYIDTLSVYADANLVLPPGAPNHSGNHSCNPNTWWTDPFSTVATHDIAVGDEVTIDYATITDDDNFSMPCRCGSPACRGAVAGADWRRSDLQDRYGQHWVPVLQDRIAHHLA